MDCLTDIQLEVESSRQEFSANYLLTNIKKVTPRYKNSQFEIQSHIFNPFSIWIVKQGILNNECIYIFLTLSELLKYKFGGTGI